MTDRLQALAGAGVSIWLDDLSRERIATGNLAAMVKESSVVGVTTNPTIFAGALSDGERYDSQIRELVAEGADADRVIFELTTADVRDACDVLAPVYAEQPADGRVSIEVEPGLAHQTEATVESARALWTAVNRPNALIKVPATVEGLPAITQLISEGISVNVTLIFSLERYHAVMEAYLTGLEAARASGRDLSLIHSVASFFVSRVDSEVDARLEALGTDEALALRGQAALANARLAHAAYLEVFSGPRWETLAAAGANPQRPLWASTGVKNPDYPDTRYVHDLVVAGTVNTMPEPTLQAYADHGPLDADGAAADTVSGTADAAQRLMDALGNVGIDFDDVLVKLEREGVEKFVTSWDELVATVKGQMSQE